MDREYGSPLRVGSAYTNFDPGAATNTGSLDCVDFPAGTAVWRMRGCNQMKSIVCMQV